MPLAAVLGTSDCERIGAGLLAQPVNALSSLAYVAAAGVVLARASKTTGRRRAELAAFAASLAAVGLGSVAYHGPQPGWAQQVHDGSIAVALVIAAAAPGLRRGWLEGGRMLASVAGLAVLAYAAGRTESPLCVPDSPVQPHALWHALSAGVAVLVAWKMDTRDRGTADR